MLKQDCYKIIYYINDVEYFSEKFTEEGKKTHHDRAEQIKGFFSAKLRLNVTYKITKL